VEDKFAAEFAVVVTVPVVALKAETAVELELE
jgi:hypothetical protein